MDALKQTRKAQPIADLSDYEKKMRKMAKMVSKILYYRILYTHTKKPKASKAALLFNEKNFLPSNKQIHTTCHFGM